MGHWKLGNQQPYVTQSEKTRDNKHRLTELCERKRSTMHNTRFQPGSKKKATFREAGTEGEPPWDKAVYVELDIGNSMRLNNSFVNIEADTNAHIKSDRFPEWATCRTKLSRQIRNTGSNININIRKE